MSRPGGGPPAAGENITIAQLRPYLKQVNCVFIVLEKTSVTKTKEQNTITHALVADSTASVSLSLWDQLGEMVQPGDILRLKGGYCTLYKNSLVLSSGKLGTIERIGEFCMLFSETPNMSAFSWVPQDPTQPNNPAKFKACPPGSPDVPPQFLNQVYGPVAGPGGPGPAPTPGPGGPSDASPLPVGAAPRPNSFPPRGAGPQQRPPPPASGPGLQQAGPGARRTSPSNAQADGPGGAAGPARPGSERPRDPRARPPS
eukprot:tig00000383_g24635.t1